MGLSLGEVATFAAIDETTILELIKDPVHTYPDIFESATLFAHLASFHTYPVNPAYESASF